MTYLDSVRVAFLNLKANMVRSLLSMLGVIIGTAAVIVVISLVNGSRESDIESWMAGIKGVLTIRVKYSGGDVRRITMDDVEYLKKTPHVVDVLPDVKTMTDMRGPLGRANGTLGGVNMFYVENNKYVLVSGRLFSAAEIETRSSLCLITDQFARKMFRNQYPIGQKIRLPEAAVEVIGVVRPPARSLNPFLDMDVMVSIPTAMRFMKKFPIYSIDIHAGEENLEKVKASLTQLISLNPEKSDYLELIDPRDMYREAFERSRSLMIQMILIACISLMVGGIGLMNVMLTSVAERTHEIGLRKALGASSRVILHQFLIESMTLSGVGGLSGVFLGTMVSYSLGVLSHGKIYVSIPFVALVVSFVFSSVIGLVFGLFPASKAAHLSPVEALRYE